MAMAMAMVIPSHWLKVNILDLDDDVEELLAPSTTNIKRLTS